MVKIRPTVTYCCQSNNGQAVDTQSIDQKNVYKKSYLWIYFYSTGI